jgi:hypothetical protein
MEQTSLFNMKNNPCLPSNKSQQGQQAVRSGRAAEALIYCILSQRGYQVDRQAFVGQSIKGGEIRADFLVHGIKQFPDGLIIESKWQETPGTADEKLFGLALDIQTNYPCPTIVVVAGGGAREQIVTWLRNQVNGGILYAVFDFEQFLTWAIRSL